MNFKQQLEKAERMQKMRSGEIITSTYIAAILWQKSKPDTQRSMLSLSKTKGLKLSIDQITALKKCFSFVPVSLWLGDSRVFDALEKMSKMYTTKEVADNNELSMMWILLNSDYYPKVLVEKYILEDETLTCTGWMTSNCCDAKLEFIDICSDCKEHCDTQCSDCEIYNECNNENKGAL